jgi:hypothetical protein
MTDVLQVVQLHIENMHLTKDRTTQTQAYYALLALTDAPVTWAYAVWDGLLSDLKHPDAHVRAIAAQVLANLAKSDPDARLLHDFERLFALAYDVGFVTARHSMQSFWKVGAAGTAQRALLLDALETRFYDCASEKNATLIRYDICECMRKIYDATGDESCKVRAETLIESETDLKYRKKYAKLWK